MNKLWQLAGKAAYWLSWPALLVYLAVSERTRIVIVVGGEVLVVRGWLRGDEWWGLPGGGLHRNEPPKQGAIRELKEETGIEVNATDLQKLSSGKIKTKHGFRYYVHAYAVRLKSKPALVRQKFELTHLEWVDARMLAEDSRTAEDVRSLVKKVLQ